MSKKKSDNIERKWGITSDGSYRPIGRTTLTIDPGVYRIEYDDNISLRKIEQVTDGLIELPNRACTAVLRGIEKFWESEARYRKYGMIYKRGVLLEGPPGGGKTVTLNLLMRKLIAEGGIVTLFGGSAGLTSMGHQMIRQIEPKRRIICVIEDIDEIVSRHGTSDITSMLDGETQVDGIVMVATTNHLDKLPQVIVNRPSRFDEIIHVGMPGMEDRLIFLRARAEGVPEKELERWAKDTAGFSIAHLKELCAAVLCLEHPYQQAVSRLCKMLGIPEPGLTEDINDVLEQALDKSNQLTAMQEPCTVGA